MSVSLTKSAPVSLVKRQAVVHTVEITGREGDVFTVSETGDAEWANHYADVVRNHGGPIFADCRAVAIIVPV